MWMCMCCRCVVVVEGSVEGCKALMDYVATLHTDTQALRQAMRSVTDRYGAPPPYGLQQAERRLRRVVCCVCVW